MCVIIGSNRPVRAATVNGSLDFAVISSESSKRLTKRTELLYSPDVQKSNNLGKRMVTHVCQNMSDAFDFFYQSN